MFIILKKKKESLESIPVPCENAETVAVRIVGLVWVRPLRLTPTTAKAQVAESWVSDSVLLGRTQNPSANTILGPKIYNTPEIFAELTEMFYLFLNFYFYIPIIRLSKLYFYANIQNQFVSSLSI